MATRDAAVLMKSDVDRLSPTLKEQVGRRFICDGYFGTVRFVGEVPPTEGLWLGVEWDDPSRGKHDGTNNERRYFETRHPTSGSFLRPKCAVFGRSCLEAIRAKYCDMKSLDPEADDSLPLFQRNNAIMTIELVGYAKIISKQSKLNTLTVIDLTDARVSQAGPNGELLHAVPNVIELNLSRNLFASWNEVANVCGQMRRLEMLDVSSTKWLQFPESVSSSESLSTSFAGVKVVVMNRMAYNWKQVLEVCAMFPRLEVLGLAFNGITGGLDIPVDAFKSLSCLDLEGNHIGSWEEVNKLGFLTRLKMLYLNATGLNSLSLRKDLFPSLESLSLHDNQISDWRHVNELDKLQSLVGLQISNNPVTENYDFGRAMIIARIGRLEMFNRTVIFAVERRSAELDYLKKYGREWLRAVQRSSETDFLADHPRFRYLIDVHGASEEWELDMRPVALKNSLISLEIRCQQIDLPVTSRKLPGTMNVQKLRSLVHRLTKLEDPVLYCESCKKPGHETEMENDMRQLSFYAEDGDTVWVR